MVVNDEMLNFAKKISQKSSLIKQKMSAVLINKKNPVTYLYGFNYYLNKESYKCKFSIHAEEDLLINAAKKGICVKGTTILIYRHMEDGYGNSKPCHVCHSKLIKAGVKNVIFYDGTDWVRANLKQLPITYKIRSRY